MTSNGGPPVQLVRLLFILVCVTAAACIAVPTPTPGPLGGRSGSPTARLAAPARPPTPWVRPTATSVPDATPSFTDDPRREARRVVPTRQARGGDEGWNAPGVLQGLGLTRAEWWTTPLGRMGDVNLMWTVSSSLSRTTDARTLTAADGEDRVWSIGCATVYHPYSSNYLVSTFPTDNVTLAPCHFRSESLATVFPDSEGDFYLSTTVSRRLDEYWTASVGRDPRGRGAQVANTNVC